MGKKRPSGTRWGAGLLIVLPKDSSVLLLRRSEEMSKPGFWGVPGGSGEAGEEPEEAALREAREELGGLPRIRLLPAEPFWHARGPFFVFATFLAEFAAGQELWRPRLNPESDDWGWFDSRSLPSPLMSGARLAIFDLLGQMARLAGRRRPPAGGLR